MQSAVDLFVDALLLEFQHQTRQRVLVENIAAGRQGRLQRNVDTAQVDTFGNRAKLRARGESFDQMLAVM